MSGRIVLVGTPIGNLGDLAPRAVEALRAAEAVFCEDTRRTRALLSHLGITGARLVSLHEHNEADRVREVLEAATGGASVAVVSDAGMPTVSDPGGALVAAAAAAGVEVTVVPGPSAVLAALAVSGLPTDRFTFLGFPPRKGPERAALVAEAADCPHTVVLFEAPHRLARTLADLAGACGEDRAVVVARELTKRFEEVWRGSLAEAVAHTAEQEPRGEYVLVLAGRPPAARPEVDDGELLAALGARRAAGERTRGAVDAVAAEFGVARRRVYRLATAGPGTEPPAGALDPVEPVLPGDGWEGA